MTSRVAVLLALLLLPAALHAQSADIRGRVVERGSERGIAAQVAVEGGASVQAGDNGEFRLRSVRTGRVALTVRALGYATFETTLFLARDTTLTIQLDAAPIVLAPVEGRARSVTIRGVVREQASGAVLMRTEVTLGDRRDATDLLGRFRFERVTAGQPLALAIRAFGYMPVQLSLTAERDTTLSFELVPDPIMQEMITAEVSRLEQRYAPLRQSMMPPIGRAELMKHSNMSVLELVKMKYQRQLIDVRCLMIDDVHRNSFGNAPFAYLFFPPASRMARDSIGVGEILANYLPDEFERIEIMQAGGMRRAYIMRLYTRGYIARMTAGGVTLKPPVFVDTGNQKEPLCR